MELLARLVGTSSEFPNEESMGELLAGLLEERGFRVRMQEVAGGRHNVLAEREGSGGAGGGTGMNGAECAGAGNDGRAGGVLGFYGHMDTVPALGEWKADPLRLRQEGDRLIGLGAYDMKGGIWAILRAAEKECNARVRIAFGVDEECDSRGAHALRESGFFRGCDAILVPEINDSTVQREGTMLLGRRGRCVFDIRVRGASCHAAHGGGINAIDEAARLVAALSEMEMPRDIFHGRATQYVREISGGERSLSYPEECTIVLDRHLVGDETAESALRSLEGYIGSLGLRASAEVRLRPRETPYLEPYAVPSTHPAVKRVSELVFPVYPSQNFASGLSVADECVLASEAPVVSLGPVGGNPHMGEEWVSRKGLFRLADAYSRILRGWQ